MSVRTKPRREQIESAEALYERMRADAQSDHPGIALARGEVVRTGWRGQLQARLHFNLRRQLLALGAVLMGASWGIGKLASSWPG